MGLRNPNPLEGLTELGGVSMRQNYNNNLCRARKWVRVERNLNKNRQI